MITTNTLLKAAEAVRIAPAGSAAVSALFANAKDDLARVEEQIRHAFRSDSTLLSEISRYLLDLGGKRVRPVMALTCGQLFGLRPASQELVEAAAGIELIHMATLLHDDIIDRSPTRRHQASAFKAYGLAPSLLAGDFLLARAFGLCAHLDRFVIDATETACIELTEGEVVEGELSPESPKTIEEYLWVVKRKTASLFGLAAAVGAHIAGATEDSVTKLREFGYLTGIAFQMVDDILDVMADEDLLGKPSGTDLLQKTPSLVNILWLESGDPEAVAFFSKANIGSEEAKVAVSSLRGSAVIDRSRSIAEEYANRAVEMMNSVSDPLFDTNTRDRLVGLVEYTLKRVM